MNYIREINAFYDWLETNSISTSCIALWHALMAINNKAGWITEFAVAVSTLEAKTGLKKKTIERSRNELKQKGLIDWKPRKGNQSAIYIMNSLCVINNPQTVPQYVPQSVSQTVPQSVAINKLNKTNTNDTREPLLEIIEAYTQISGKPEQYLNGIDREEARKLANSEIPIDFILQTMNETAAGRTINSMKFFTKAVPDRWDKSKIPPSNSPERNSNTPYDLSRTDAAFSKFTMNGGNPDEFDWSKHY